jgi:hypothetical protein
MLNLGMMPLMICIGVGVVAQVKHLAFREWAIIMITISVILTTLVAATLPKSLHKVLTVTSPAVRNAEDRQAERERRKVLRMITGLSSLSAIISLTVVVLIAKYNMITAGLILSTTLSIPSIWIIKTSRRLNLISRAREAPTTELDPSKQTQGYRRRFHLFFVPLTGFSMSAAFLFWACAYLIIVGDRSVPILSCLLIGLLCLALVPLFSGLVVRKLGLLETIQT